MFGSGRETGVWALSREVAIKRVLVGKAPHVAESRFSRIVSYPLSRMLERYRSAKEEEGGKEGWMDSGGLGVLSSEEEE